MSEFMATHYIVLTGYQDDETTLSWVGEQVSNVDTVIFDLGSDGSANVSVDYMAIAPDTFTGYVIEVDGVSYGVFGANAFFVPYNETVSNLALSVPFTTRSTSVKRDSLPITYLPLNTTDEADTVQGTSLDDSIDAGQGDDVLFGGDGNDSLSGGPGHDTVEGQAGDDLLHGDFEGSGVLGDDVLRGGDGDDTLFGDAGNDELDGGPGNDSMEGGDGDDTLIFREGNEADIFDGGQGTDTFLVIPNVSGTQRLTDATLRNLEIFRGTTSQSYIIDPGQLDQFTSISDISTIFHAVSGVSDLANAIASGEVGQFEGNNGADRIDISGADTGWTLYGFAGEDTLIGGEGDDLLDGGDGDDDLIGGGGNDTLRSSGGRDRLDGGDGDDTFSIFQNGTLANPNSDLMDGGAGNNTLRNDTFSAAQLQGFTLANIQTLVAGNVIANPGQLEIFDNIRELNQLTHATAGSTDLTGRVVSLLGSSFFFNGADGDDTLIASDLPGRVQINASRGNDVAITGAGNDTIIGGAGANDFDAGGGDDRIEGREGADTLLGGEGRDTLFGGTDDDSLLGGAGADDLQGQAGDDLLEGGEGDDIISGGSGDDTAAFDLLSSEVTVTTAVDGLLITSVVLGADSVANDVENFRFRDGTFSFAQVELMAQGIATITGTDAGENVNGTPDAEVINARAGNDWITPGGGNDTVDGGDGRDMLSFFDLPDTPGRTNMQYRLTVDMEAGTAASHDGSEQVTFTEVERFTGTVFADYVRGSTGDDEIRGLGDYDWFVATTGNDTYDGGTGQDMISYVEWLNDAPNTVGDPFETDGVPPLGGAVTGVVVNLTDPSVNTNLAAGDVFTSVERITGSGRQDVFVGDAGQNDFRGLGDFDWFVSSDGGRERYNGGDGVDTVTYFNAPGAITASLRNGAVVNGQETGYGTEGWAARDLYFEIENLVGSNYGDSLTGNNGRNQINGLAGDDIIFGYGGIDYMKGGGGNDTINGGAASDYALFDGNRGDYTLTKTSSSTVTVSGADGTDSLIDVEYFVFDDAQVTIWELPLA